MADKTVSLKRDCFPIMRGGTTNLDNEGVVQEFRGSLETSEVRFQLIHPETMKFVNLDPARNEDIDEYLRLFSGFKEVTYVIPGTEGRTRTFWVDSARVQRVFLDDTGDALTVWFDNGRQLKHVYLSEDEFLVAIGWAEYDEDDETA